MRWSYRTLGTLGRNSQHRTIENSMNFTDRLVGGCRTSLAFSIIQILNGHFAFKASSTLLPSKRMLSGTIMKSKVASSGYLALLSKSLFSFSFRYRGECSRMIWFSYWRMPMSWPGGRWPSDERGCEEILLWVSQVFCG